MKYGPLKFVIISSKRKVDKHCGKWRIWQLVQTVNHIPLEIGTKIFKKMNQLGQLVCLVSFPRQVSCQMNGGLISLYQRFIKKKKNIQTYNNYKGAKHHEILGLKRSIAAEDQWNGIETERSYNMVFIDIKKAYNIHHKELPWRYEMKHFQLFIFGLFRASTKKEIMV